MDVKSSNKQPFALALTSTANFEFSICLTCMCLDWRKKLDFLERTSKCHAERPQFPRIEPATYRLWGSRAHHLCVSFTQNYVEIYLDQSSATRGHQPGDRFYSRARTHKIDLALAEWATFTACRGEDDKLPSIIATPRGHRCLNCIYVSRRLIHADLSHCLCQRPCW